MTLSYRQTLVAEYRRLGRSFNEFLPDDEADDIRLALAELLREIAAVDAATAAHAVSL